MFVCFLPLQDGQEVVGHWVLNGTVILPIFAFLCKMCIGVAIDVLWVVRLVKNPDINWASGIWFFCKLFKIILSTIYTIFSSSNNIFIFFLVRTSTPFFQTNIFDPFFCDFKKFEKNPDTR